MYHVWIMPYHVDYFDGEVEDEEDEEDRDDVGGMFFGLLDVISSLMWSLTIHLSGVTSPIDVLEKVGQWRVKV